MTRNELVLLDRALEAEQENRETPLAKDVAFELFACEQVLKKYELSTDDIETGRIGGGGDGGLDGVYVFLGESLLAEDADVLSDDVPASSFERGLQLTLWLVQAKTEESFGETAIDKAEASLRRLLDLQEDDEDLLTLYSPELVQRIRMFTAAWQKLAARRVRIKLGFAYASRGDTSNIDPKVETKANQLSNLLGQLVPGARTEFRFLGSAELWDLYNTTASYDLSLDFQESITRDSSHVAIVTLRDYLAFITDDSGAIRRHIFDWNVRDYQGEVEVNREIRESLDDATAPEFWWMNNGVTIVCSDASIVGKTYSLHDVQIVNGLQTSHTIYEAYRERDGDLGPAGDRAILVRILPTRDPTVRDQVIRATNRQTSVAVASLRATDNIQRQIESFFEQNGWYYDRRKNYWRNTGKPSERIVSIPFLAQSVMAIGLSEPNIARARPSSLLKRDEDYRRIFSSDVSLEIYLWLARTQRRVDSYLSSDAMHVTGSQKTNLRFYVSMVSGGRLFGGRIYSPQQLRKLAQDNETLPESIIKEAFEDLSKWASEFMEAKGWPLDRTAKSKDFAQFVLRKTFPEGANESEGKVGGQA